MQTHFELKFLIMVEVAYGFARAVHVQMLAFVARVKACATLCATAVGLHVSAQAVGLHVKMPVSVVQNLHSVHLVPRPS